MASYSSLGGGLVIVTNAGAPSNGTSGTGAGVAGPGSLLVDSTNCNLYQNTNTKASPTWTQFSDLGTTPAFTDVDVGADGTAGSLDIFPASASNGKIIITATNNGAARNLTITNAALGQTTALVIPDPGAAAGRFVLTNSAHNLIVNCNSGARALSLAGDVSFAAAASFAGAVSVGGTLTTGGNVTFSGAFSATINVPSSSTWTLPSGGGTLALATGAETGTTASSFTVDSDSANAKIALNTNAATGNFTVSLVPTNLTANRTITFPDATGTVMLLSGTETVTANITQTGTLDLQGNVTASAGNPALNFSGSSGAFSTSTGTFTHYGNVANNGNVTWTWSSSGAWNMGGSSGTFTTPTGTNTLSGDVTIAAGKQLDIGTAAGGDATPLRIFSATAANGILVIKAQDDTDNNTTTLQTGNPGAGINPTITLPIATCTLVGLGLANTFTAAQAVTLDDETDGVVNALTLTHSSSDNNATAADGVGVSFQLENATGTSTVEEWASIDVVSTTITNGSEDGDVVISLMANGAVTEAMRLDSSDQSLTIGVNATDGDGFSKLRIFPLTASKGSLLISATASAGDTVTEITNASQAGARTYTIPDAGASANFLMSAGAQTASGAQTLSAGAATPAVALRFGATPTEGLEIKVYDEQITLTNAASTNTTLAIPAGAVVLSAQVNLTATVVGDASGDDLLAKVGLGVAADENKYGVTADLAQNTKIDTIPAWAVNSGETLALYGLQADGATVCTEKFVAGSTVRVRVVYAVCNSLDNA